MANDKAMETNAMDVIEGSDRVSVAGDFEDVTKAAIDIGLGVDLGGVADKIKPTNTRRERWISTSSDFPEAAKVLMMESKANGGIRVVTIELWEDKFLVCLTREGELICWECRRCGMRPQP